MIRSLAILTFFSISVAFGAQTFSGDSVYQLHSSWETQDGKTIQLGDFSGEPLVLAMIYTQCTDACPLLVLDVRKIEKKLRPDTRNHVHFALVSFNSENDNPATLKKYASAHDLDPKHWTLLSGSKESVRELSAVLGVRYRQIARDEYAHSSVITVLDSAGVIRLQQKGLGNKPDAAVSQIKKLLKH